MLQKLKKLSLIWCHARPASIFNTGLFTYSQEHHKVTWYAVFQSLFRSFYLQNGCANKISHTISHIVWYPTNNYVNQSKSDADIIQLNCNLTPEEMQKNVYVINTMEIKHKNTYKTSLQKRNLKIVNSKKQFFMYLFECWSHVWVTLEKCLYYLMSVGLRIISKIRKTLVISRITVIHSSLAI